MPGAEDFEKELTKKGPGGIPVWGYGVALGGGIVLFQLIRNHQAGTGATGASAGATAPGTGTAYPNTATTTTIAGGYQGPWRPPWRYWWRIPGGPPPVPQPHTDQQWQKLAEDWLLSKGEDPKLVTDSLDDYLHRQRLSEEEEDIVDLAIQGWGSPPEGSFHIIEERQPQTGDRGRKRVRLHENPQGGGGPGGTGPIDIDNTGGDG